MPRTRGASLQPAERRFVYDSDPNETTRPDTVPAALRFAEASALSSGVAHAKPRELSPYPRLPTLPEITTANDDATVVDPPLAQPRQELRSGPRHRTAATVSTVPPPSRARKIARVEVPAAPVARVAPVTPVAPVAQSEEPPRIFEQARTITTSPPTAHAQKRWPFALALAVTAVAAAVFGTALGNGSIDRALGRQPSPAVSPPAVSPPVVRPASVTREAPRPSSLRPNGEHTPSEADDAPVVRIEDLPLADEGKGKRTMGTGRRVRAKAGRR